MSEINLGEHVSIFGITGSGKSTLTRQIASAMPRKIVFDRLGEWRNEPGAIICQSFHAFVTAYRENFLKEYFTLVFIFPPGVDYDALSLMTESALELIYYVEMPSEQNKIPRGTAIIFEEVWLYCDSHSMPPWMNELYLTGRHGKISLIANAQRPASVHKSIVSQSRHVFIGQFFESRDALYFRETVGDIPELRQILPKYEFVWFKPNGEKPLRIHTNAAQ